jgi:hypothetical protein
MERPLSPTERDRVSTQVYDADSESSLINLPISSASTKGPSLDANASDPEPGSKPPVLDKAGEQEQQRPETLTNSSRAARSKRAWALRMVKLLFGNILSMPHIPHQLRKGPAGENCKSRRARARDFLGRVFWRRRKNDPDESEPYPVAPAPSTRIPLWDMENALREPVPEEVWPILGRRIA